MKKIILGIIVAMIVIVGAWYVLKPASNMIGSTNVDASDWKTYNAKGFSVDYPKQWSVQNGGDERAPSITFISPDSKSGFDVIAGPSAGNFKADFLINTYIDLFGSKLQKKDVTVSGVNASELSFSDDSVQDYEMHVIFDKNGNTYEIDEHGAAYYQSDSFTKFLSSLKVNN